MPQESYKIALFGDGAVGKTAIAVKFCRGTFLITYDPTIEDSYRKLIQADGKAAFLEIIDTAGQDDYATLRDQWLHEGDAYILVYAINNKKSFQRISAMGPSIVRARQKSPHAYPVSMLVGNKCDLDGNREVNMQEGADLARKFGCEFIETSAKTGVNIRRVFEDLVIALRARAAGLPSRAPPGTLWNSPMLGQGSFSTAPSSPRTNYPSPSNRYGSTPSLRPSQSQFPLQSRAQGPHPPTINPPGGTVRIRSSANPLRSPTVVQEQPPLPPPPLPRNRAELKEREKKEKAEEKERAKRNKEKRKQMERQERDGRGGKDGKCVIC